MEKCFMTLDVNSLRFEDEKCEDEGCWNEFSSLLSCYLSLVVCWWPFFIARKRENALIFVSFHSCPSIYFHLNTLHSKSSFHCNFILWESDLHIRVTQMKACKHLDDRSEFNHHVEAYDSTKFQQVLCRYDNGASTLRKLFLSRFKSLDEPSDKQSQS